MHIENRCSAAFARARFIAPTALPESPALRFELGGSEGSALIIRFPDAFYSVSAPVEHRTVRVCLKRISQVLDRNLELRIENPGACLERAPQDVWVDNIELFDDPSCP